MNKENGIIKHERNLPARREQSVVKHADVINGEYRVLSDGTQDTGTGVKTNEKKGMGKGTIALAATTAACAGTLITLGLIAAKNNCLWGCEDRRPTHVIENRVQTPSQAPGTPNQKENLNLCGYTWKHLNPGECARVNAGDFFMGDGSVDGVFMTDSNENTGAIYNFERSAEIRADFGGDIRTPINPNEKPRLIAEATRQMLDTGGVNNRGVHTVFVTTFRANGQNEVAPFGRK